MKKIISYVTVLAMMLTCFGFGTVSANAIEKNSSQKQVTNKAAKKSPYKEGEALVVFKSGGTLTRANASDSIGLGADIQIDDMWDFEAPAEIPENGKLLKRMTGNGSAATVNVALVKSDTLTTEQLISKLKLQKNVKLAEPNYKIKAMGVNDPYFGKQWNLENKGQNNGIPGKSANASAKWDTGVKGSDEQVVAIVDSGVDYTHEDLRDNIWENTYQPELRGECGFDFINGDTDPMDDNGHGTHCAGIIGAQGNNGVGISGVNQDVKIMALKILDSDGEGYASDEISAYHYINKAMSLGVNVVAINNSWGGGGESEIFEMLIDIVGQKGAVTVCAAGNEYNDNDEEGPYPANIESPYKLSVAASNEDNELAAFSNYGKESVDLAAPGTDILSTVSYGCYNPGIYSESKRNELSENFNDFESADNTWAIPDEATVSTGSSEYTAEITEEENFGEPGGKSLRLTFEGLAAGEVATARIPYEMAEGYVMKETSQTMSVMAKVNGPEINIEDYDPSMFILIDAPRGKAFNNEMDLFMTEYLTGTYVAGENNFWDHFNVECGNFEKTPKEERDLVLGIYAVEGGDYEVYLDDIGLSKKVNDTDVFGKYDFYNGSSMAAPHVTGAIALAAAENPDADSEGLIDEVLTHVKSEPALADKTSEGGALDLSCKEELAPRIGSVTVKTADKHIIIKGGGFTDSTKVKIDGKDAEIVSRTDRELVIKDNSWINRIVDIEISSGSKTKLKEDVYLVKGKVPYTALDEDFEFASYEGIMSTNGKKMYEADSMTDTIYIADPADGKYMEFEELFTVKPEKFFKKDSESKADYDFTFGYDLPYADGKLYNIAAYSEVGVSDEDDYEDYSADYYEEDEEDYYYETGAGAAFSSQYKLMCFDLNTGKITSLGNLPSDVKRTEDWTLASYNGKIYLIGGYDYSTKSISKKVKIYNPDTKKWSNGPLLPEGRAGGRAVQTGNSLVYTMGYGANQTGVELKEQKCPVNLTLTGSTWKKSAKQLEPYYVDLITTKNGNKYYWYDASVGICSYGLLYAGMPVAGLGDTFMYNPAYDKYTSSKYNFTEYIGGDFFVGVAVGSTLYGYSFWDEYGYKAAINSGLVKVSAPKYKWGYISGANKSWMPGKKITLTAKANKGHYVRSFYVDGKKVSGKVKTVRLTKNQKATAVFGKYVTKISLNKTSMSLKAGKNSRLKVKVYPTSATNKGVIYKTSNKRYATVSSQGLITAKRAGIGKTVTITVKAKDGSGRYAKCKVKITR